MDKQQVCKRCILDSSVPSVTFDVQGICNHCRLHDKLEKKYAINATNEKKFKQLLETIKRKGRNNKYDCIVGLSGGIDSTYCLYMAKQLGLRPLAFHYGNAWCTDIARKNIEKAIGKLGVDLEIIEPPWEEVKKFHKACLKASIPETCLPCEVGGVSAMYKIAEKYNVKYIILGTSFKTEGINPLRWHYVDGTYFNDIMKKFGELNAQTKDFNNLTITGLFKNIILKGIKTIQLPLYIEYKEENIKAVLKKELDWEYGGRVHFDCSYKPFGGYLEKQKFGRDPSKISLSALVRSGELTRKEALEKIHAEESRPIPQKEINFCLERLSISPDEFQSILKEPPKTFLDYTTSYSLISKLRVPLKVCSKLKLLPETLYEKFFSVV